MDAYSAMLEGYAMAQSGRPFNPPFDSDRLNDACEEGYKSYLIDKEMEDIPEFCPAGPLPLNNREELV